MQQLRLAREAKGWSQRALGRKMKKHHTYVSLCESGERQLNIIELREWCRTLEISWVEFTREMDALLDKLSLDELGDESPENGEQ